VVRRSKVAVPFGAVALLATGLLFAFAPPAAATPASADMAVVVTDHPDPVVAKTKLTYTISVTNVGTPAATAVAVTVHDLLSTTQTYVSSHTSQGNCAFTLGSFDFALGDVGPGVTAIVKLVVKEAGALQDSTSVSVSASSPDPVPSNNTAHALTSVQKAPPNPSKSPKPSRSVSATPTASPTPFEPTPGGSSSTALPIMGAIVAALGFIVLAGYFAFREHRTP
jgi:uncharacterized repeat protein (TIGR01451 family)